MTQHEAVYKTADGVGIGATIVCSGNSSGPVLLLIHGGACIFGNRSDSLGKQEVERFLDAGFSAAVSVDYRLAPESKLPDMIRDLEDAWRWVDGGADGLLPNKGSDYCLMGHSAGGYLSLLMAAKLPKKPKAVFSFYGYCNIIADWYTKPSEHYCAAPEVTKEDALNCVYKHPALSDCREEPHRWKFYLYTRQKGLWVDYVTGMRFAETPVSCYDPFCPVVLADHNYPPVFFAHGTEDTDVPFEQSAIMKARLDELRIPNVLHIAEHCGHGFDADDAWRKSENGRLMEMELSEFISKHAIG